MPALPEFTDGTGCVGIIEVFLEGEAEHAAETDGHIGIPGKIKVDLKGIKQHLQPLQSRGKAAGGQVKQDIRIIPEGIGQDHFFRKAVAETFDTVSPFCQGRLALIDLGCNIPVFDDGTRNELRKQGNIKQDLPEILLRIHIPPVNIDHVAHGLKGVEGNAERQRDLRRRENLFLRDAVDETDQKIKVLEIPEQKQVYRDRQKKEQLFLLPEPVDQPRAGIVHCNGTQHQENVDRLTPRIKKEARDQ